jgi:murein DD-endopeptidase MepM/ murein hydrolase activator NlpD
LHLERWQLAILLLGAFCLLLALSGAIYHLIFMKAAREGWPFIGDLVQVIAKDEFAQRDRFMKENLNAMAKKVGEMQAKMVKLEAVSLRVSGLAGIKPDELKAIEAAVAASASASASEATTPTQPASGASSTAPVVNTGGRGGPFIPADTPSFTYLNQMMDRLDEMSDYRSDVFTLSESNLLESKIESLSLPSIQPVAGPIGSGFGFRVDPFTGRAALHTGLDFPVAIGTPIRAAAGGVVISTLNLPSYGQMVEIDHGNRLHTRYAHSSKILVRTGQMIRRGDVVALVGSTGRSTGPHLHFEVLFDGVPQNPAKFLARGNKPESDTKTASAKPVSKSAKPGAKGSKKPPTH